MILAYALIYLGGIVTVAVLGFTTWRRSGGER